MKKSRYITDIKTDFVLKKSFWYRLKQLRFNPIWRMIIVLLLSAIGYISVKILFDIGFLTF